MERFVPPAQRLFDDPIVLDLLPPIARFLLRTSAGRAAVAALSDTVAPGVRGALLCRTRRIDDAVRDCIARGLGMLVILGAGLDTRAYRLRELAGVRILELDLPEVQEFKKACLSRRFGGPPPQVRFVPVDFNSEALDQALARGGFPAEPAVFVWEGVSQYLPPATVDGVLRTIAGRPAGTELIFTYVLEEVITGNFRPDRSKAFRKSARSRPEPWLFGIAPAQLKDYLAARGLALRSDFGADEYQAQYLRPIGRRLEVSEIERVATATV